ncbi:transposable element Tcb2 transposase [Trichonephila clavipes]|nr:transposable element Tcb2 transposase [Trichonephila clavipes]
MTFDTVDGVRTVKSLGSKDMDAECRKWQQPNQTKRTPSIDQSSRRPSHRTKCTFTANCFIGAIRAQVAPSLGALVSSRTIRKCLAEGHLGSRRPLCVLPVTPTHRRLRLKWCHARGNWTAAEWNRIVFNDEFRFNLSSDDNRDRVWRLCGERLNYDFALQRHTAPTASMMVRGAIAYSTRSPLVLICGTMWYVHGILQPHVLPLMQRLTGIIFQQDNATPHTTRVSQDCLRPVTTFPWPARFPVCLQLSIFWIIWDGELGIQRV